MKVRAGISMRAIMHHCLRAGLLLFGQSTD